MKRTSLGIVGISALVFAAASRYRLFEPELHHGFDDCASTHLSS